MKFIEMELSFQKKHNKEKMAIWRNCYSATFKIALTSGAAPTFPPFP